MKHRERVMAAVAGAPVDRVPVSFWLHNHAREHSAEALADETVRLHQTFDWDFLKPQSRATCFAEMWGAEIAFSSQQTVPYSIRRHALADVRELGALTPADAAKGALAEQLAAYLNIEQRVGPDVPIVATVFAPLMTAVYMQAGGRDAVLKLMRDDPAALDRGLAAIAETLSAHVANCIAAGLDGVFYATTMATRPLISTEECRRFQRPHDLAVLAAARSAPFNILHVCGNNTLFDEFLDYPVAVFSWATTPGNPSLADVRDRTGRAVLGGLPGKPEIASMQAPALVARAHQSIRATGGRKHLLGPDCSINPGTPETLLHAVGAAVAA